MASTPGDPNGYWMRLLQIKDDKGAPRMPLLRFGQPCKNCLQTSEPWSVQVFFHSPNNRLFLGFARTTSTTCPSGIPRASARSSPTSTWVRPPCARRWRLSPAFPGNKETYALEQFAVSVNEEVRPFRAEHVAALRQRPLFKDFVPPTCMFMTIDSAYGGKCDYAIMAGYFPAPGYLVVRLSLLLPPLLVRRRAETAAPPPPPSPSPRSLRRLRASVARARGALSACAWPRRRRAASASAPGR